MEPSQSESEIAECVGTINLSEIDLVISNYTSGPLVMCVIADCAGAVNLSEIDGPSTLGDFKLHFVCDSCTAN